MKLSKQQFDELIGGKKPVAGSPRSGRAKSHKRTAPQFKPRDPYEMNGLEAEFALTFLDAEIRAGRVIRYDFEPIRLVLARGLQYTPDFVAYTAAGDQVCYEVKGRWTDDARAKLKMAASQYPATFIAVMKRRKSEAKQLGLWCFETIPGSGGWPIGLAVPQPA